MGLCKIKIDGQYRLYWLFHNTIEDDDILCISNSQTQSLEKRGSSRFFLIKKINHLCKCQEDKFRPSKNIWKWFFRDIFERRVLGKADSLREFRSRNIMRSAGLKTLDYHSVGIALNPMNKFGSWLVMDYRPELLTLRQYLENNREDDVFFYDLLSEDIIKLAKLGYLNTDMHLNNILVDGKTLIWIDTHVKGFSTKYKINSDIIMKGITAEKLLGESSLAIFRGIFLSKMDALK